MGLLDTILSTIDAKKRSAKRGIMDMLDNPQQWAGMQANRIQEDRYGGAENAQAMKQYLSKQPYDPKALTAANDALRNAAINESLGAIFIGKGAKTWDKMKEADAMARLAKGEDAATVWKETGVAVAPWDKIPRGEISDHAATFSPTTWAKKYENAPNVEQAMQGDAFYHKPLSASYPDLMQADIVLNPNIKGQGSYHQPNKDIGLGEYIQMNVDRQDKMLTDTDWLNRLKDRSGDDNWKKMAEEFYASGDYPTLKAAKKDSFREMRDTQNSIDDIKSGLLYPRNAEKIPKSTLLHENQHAIQQREGFARGGSPEGMKSYIDERKGLKEKFDSSMDQFMNSSDPIAKSNAAQEMTHYGLRLGKMPNVETPDDAYRALAGEAEARLAQYRMNLTPEARAALYPYDPAYFKQATGVDIDKLITRGLLDDGPAMSVAPKLTEFEQRHLTAQKNAALPVEQGGLGLPPNNTAMDRARAMGLDTPAYHYTPYDFNEFKPHHYRGASFFADTPDGAMKGASAGNGEIQFVKVNPDHGGQIMPVLIGGKTYGESSYPDWFIPDIKKYGDYRALVDGEASFGKIPIDGLSANQEKYINGMRLEAIKKPGSILEGVPEKEWEKYPVVTNKHGNLDTHPDFPVVKGEASSKTANGFAPVDYKGFEGFGYDPWAYQPTLTREEYRDTLQKLGFDSARVADESGHAIAVMNPSVVRSRFAAFDPMRRHEADLLGYADPYLLGAMGAGGLLGMGGYSMMNDK